MTYPEYKLTTLQQLKFKRLILRRIKGEPIAYILGHKEFYGLDFIVNKHTLVPRPETESIVEDVTILLHSMLRSKQHNIIIADIGTGSGNIIISIANKLCHSERSEESQNIIASETKHEILHCSADDKLKYFGIDISEEALKIAKKNTRIHGLNKKIKFLHGSLLEPFIQNTRYKIQDTSLIIVANLPYLSKEIYNSTPIDVKKFEPKSALHSPEQGLQHYRKLLKQLQKLLVTSYELRVTIFLEISPEQKTLLIKIIKSILPVAKIEFKKDLANKWRTCKINL